MIADPAPPSISVVFCTYNRAALVVEAVTAALQDSYAKQVVVADDGSSDDTVARLQELAASEPRLTIVALGANQGRSVARQRGIEAATGDVVLLLDDDVIAAPGLASGHARHHAADDYALVLGFMPVHVTDQTNVTSRIYAQEYLGVVAQYERDSKVVLDKLWGGNVSLRREAALAIGLLAEGFENFYHQDRDFGLRCRQYGLHGIFDRALASEHRHRRGLDAFLRDAHRRGKGLSLLRSRHGDIAMNPAPPLAFLGAPVVLQTARVLSKPALALGGRPEVFAVKALRRLAQWQGATEYERENS